MKILLCWSKERSRLIAMALREWLPKVSPLFQPWMSEVDLEKGKDWSDGLHATLGEVNAIVICLTPENVRSPWIYYESGHVAASLSTNLICPYLIEQDHSILADGPLGRFQSTKAEREDTFRLLKSLNAKLEESRTQDTELGTSFEKNWPDLLGSLKRITAMEGPAAVEAEFITTEIDRLAGGNLSSDERSMILAIGEDSRAMLLVCSDSGGHHFQTGKVDLNEDNTARSTARWRAVHRSLVRRGILEMRGSKGEVFNLTDKGFVIFDALKAAEKE